MVGILHAFRYAHNQLTSVVGILHAFRYAHNQATIMNPVIVNKSILPVPRIVQYIIQSEIDLGIFALIIESCI